MRARSGVAARPGGEGRLDAALTPSLLGISSVMLLGAGSSEPVKGLDPVLIEHARAWHSHL